MSTVSEVIVVGRREIPISGIVAPGYEPVVDAFKRNFLVRRELGAACSAYVGGQCVLDLWGGFRTPRRTDPWREETMALLMSTTKGLSALTLAQAQARGLLDYDAPVIDYWPEFGQHGKSRVTVAQLLAHQAGVCAIDTTLTLELLRDPDALAEVLARQRPSWEPGTRHGYHAVSLGLYQSELLRRVDPRRRTLGAYFRDEIAGALGPEIYIGLPDAISDERIAGLKIERDLASMSRLPFRFFLDAFNPRSLVSRIARNPKLKRIADLNSRPYLRIELPSVNGLATARAIAKLYGIFAARGQQFGLTHQTYDRLERPPVVPLLGPTDAAYRVDFAYSLGFCKPFPHFPFSRSTRAYGTPGAGGSQGFADPDTELGFAYVPNRLAIGVFDDQRAVTLRDAVYSCVRK
jgi:CubicO group peptidase (beta-lactamase class C family)